MKKRILSILLAFVMLVGMLPVHPFAAGQGQVRVIVENTTYTADEGAPWDGTLVDTDIDLTNNMTMMTAILTALDNAGHTWNYNSGDWDTTYIGSIEKDGSIGLAEFDGGTGAGWKGTLNDWFVNMGFTDWKVSDGTLVAGDVIRVMYTQDMGADLGGEWGTNVGNLSSLAASAGTLSPAFDKETLDYTLTVESDVSSVDITAVAENKEDRVTVTVGGTEYRRGVGVPVSDGTEISVACGAKTYMVTVSAVQPEPVTYAVILPAETTGYTAAAVEGSASPVAAGGSYSFTVTIADGYEAGEDFAVKANDVVLTAVDGVYTIENITADQTITVEGVVEKTAEEAVPFSTEIKAPSNGNSSWGYVSKLVLSGDNGSIYEAYWSSEYEPYVLDVILGQDTPLDAVITAAFTVAGLRAPSVSGNTTVTLENGKGTIQVTVVSGISAFYSDTHWTINLTVDDGSAANRPAYEVQLPTDTVGYTVTAYNSESPVIEGRAFSFKVTIDGDYKAGEDFAVKVNGEVLEAVNGVYIIENITETKTVTVEGVVEKTLADKSVTVIAPAGSTVSSGRHHSYFKYDFSEPLEVTTLEDGRIQMFFPTQSGRQGFIRVQHPEGVTYWDFDGLTAGSVFEITEEMLFIGSEEFNKETVYADFEKNVKDKADLYLTANEKGWLDLNTGDTWNLNVFRNFLSLGNTISNDCLALPDVEYKVVTVDGEESDGVVTVTPNENNNSYAEIKAVGAGTAIILVSYDAVYNCDGEGGKQWSAIWPENTGVIIVTVDAEDASIITNMTVNEEANSGGKQVIDAEHDILFYVGGSGASYSFKPEEGCTVSVNRSTVGDTMTFAGFTASGVETAEDGTVTVTGLTTGTHIIRVEKNGQTVYQVVRARQVTYEVKHSDGSLVTEESPAQPGETVTVQFHELVSPLEKLSGVYNANFGFYYNGKQGVQVRTSGGTYGVYAFSGSEGLQKFTVTVPSAWNEETYILTDGSIKLGGFGGSFGAHRTTTYIEGKEVNTNASGTGGVASVLPDVVISTTPCGYKSFFATLSTGDGYVINGMSGDANPIREGDTYTFTVDVLGGYDGTNLVVKINGETVTATDGTYAIENVTEDLNITVEGVEKIEVEMDPLTAVYTNGVDGSGWGRNDYTYVDTISIGGVAIESYTWDGDTCNVVLKAGTAKNTAVGFVWKVGGTYENWYDQMTATLDGTPMASGETVGVKLVDGTATVEIYAIYATNSRWSDTKTFILTIAECVHTAGEAVTENEVAATCTTDGSYDTVIYCSVCGEEISRETTTIPAAGHSYEDGACTTCGEADPGYSDVESIYKTTGEYLDALEEEYGISVGTVGGEWMVIGLIRSGREANEAYYDAVVQYAREKIDENERLHRAKSTENSRVILALTAMGYDVTDVDGHNLLAGLTDMTYVKKQGINGPIWALIAFDSYNYEIPEGGDVTREVLIHEILEAQLSDGGWALSGSVSDADMTGMALTALAPYYGTNPAVKEAVDEALATLSEVQKPDGSFGSVDGSCAESCAQVIVALTALGIDPETDERFVKNGVSVIDALCDFYMEGGGFRHIAGGNLDGIATEQGYYALAAYYRFLNGQTALYDMGDVTLRDPEAPGEDPEIPDVPGEDEATNPTEPDNETTEPDNETTRPTIPSDSPQAGDESNVALYGSLMILSVAALAILLIIDQKCKFVK